MPNDQLIIPASLVGPCCRALRFTIDELSAALKRNAGDDHKVAMLAEEMFQMQDAFKSMLAALPAPTPTTPST